MSNTPHLENANKKETIGTELVMQASSHPRPVRELRHFSFLITAVLYICGLLLFQLTCKVVLREASQNFGDYKL